MILAAIPVLLRMVTRDEWLRRYQLTADGEGAVSDVGISACGLPIAPVGDRHTGGTLLPDPPDQSAAGEPPLLAITLPDWGVPPGPPVPIPWAKWEAGTGRLWILMFLMIATPMER